MPLKDTAASNETQHDDDDGDNQENMYEPAHCVRGDQAKQPEDDEDDCYSFKHLFSPLIQLKFFR
jgi:hypothetical protein